MSIDRETPLPAPRSEEDGSTVSTRRRRPSRHRGTAGTMIWEREPRPSDDPIRMAGLLPRVPCLMVIVGRGGNIVAASRLLRETLGIPLLGRDLDSILEMPGGIVWLESGGSDTLNVEGARLLMANGTRRRVTIHGGFREFEGEKLFFAMFEPESEPAPVPGGFSSAGCRPAIPAH